MVRQQILSQATTCHFAISQLEPWFMQLNFVQVVERRLLVQQELAYSSSLRMAHTHNFACHQVKFVMSMSVAAQRLVKSVTPNNQISTLEKQAVCVGRASAQLSAVLL